MIMGIRGLNADTRCLHSETLTSGFILPGDDEQRREFFLIVWQQAGYPLHRRADSREQGVVPGSRQRRSDLLCSPGAFWTKGTAAATAATATLNLC